MGQKTKFGKNLHSQTLTWGGLQPYSIWP